ncbi:hypothetical protein ACLB2K_045701 [Fragaria x ananassa]
MAVVAGRGQPQTTNENHIMELSGSWVTPDNPGSSKIVFLAFDVFPVHSSVLSLGLYWRFQRNPWSFEKWGGAPPEIWRIKLFQDFISNAMLRDLNFQGPEYTWFAIRNRKVFIKERLDRAMANIHWCTAQSKTQVFHLSKIGSDHRPILIDTLPVETKGKPLFRYENFWNDHEECIPLIRGICRTEGLANPMRRWITNLGESTLALKKWSRTVFPTSHAQVRSLIQDLEALYESEDQEVTPQLQDITENISTLWRRDVKYWQQRSRIS